MPKHKATNTYEQLMHSGWGWMVVVLDLVAIGFAVAGLWWQAFVVLLLAGGTLLRGLMDIVRGRS